MPVMSRLPAGRAATAGGAIQESPTDKETTASMSTQAVVAVPGQSIRD